MFWVLGRFLFSPYQSDLLPTVIGEKTAYIVNTNRQQIMGYIFVSVCVRAQVSKIELLKSQAESRYLLAATDRDCL